jgi:hypothetical protein
MAMAYEQVNGVKSSPIEFFILVKFSGDVRVGAKLTFHAMYST